MVDAEEAALRAYYERGEERGRLSDGRGQLEFIRTTEILTTQGTERIAAILDGARSLERVPELAGFGPHRLATAVLPAAG